MTSAIPPLSRWAMLTLAGFLLGGCYFFIQGLRATGQWWMLVVLLVFIGFTVLLATQRIQQWQQGVLAALLLLTTAMTFWVPSHMAMLYVVVSLLAIETLPKRRAIGWVCACVAAVFASELITSTTPTDIQDASVNSLLTLFLSGFAFLRSEAETGRQQTRILLSKLEIKNRQLSDFTLDREQQNKAEARQQLSRELHDTLGHTLTISIVQLEAAEKFLARDPNRAQRILTTARQLLITGLDETRKLVRLMDEGQAENVPLAQALPELVENFQRLTAIKTTLTFDADEALLSAQCKQHLFRIVQEALTNISRHANATEATIILTGNAELSTITLQVSDNGRRLKDDESKPLPSIKSIESRVAELNGSITFSRKGQSTKLCVEIPIIHIGDYRA